jgi:acid phosphatase family membrane protein YuiD
MQADWILIFFTVGYGIVPVALVSIGAVAACLLRQSGRDSGIALPKRDSMLHTIGIASLLSGLLAQFMKVVLAFNRTRSLRFERLFDTGGMPSSHAALVTTLAIGVAFSSGITSPIFSVVLIFSLYVVFEAAGLRQEVGKQARVLNDLVDDLRVTHHLNRSRLKELVGHTWGEVIVGFVIGLIVAIVAYR